MSSKRVGEIIVETLQNAGVKHCYGIVGDTLNYITDAIYRSKIEWVHTRHEEAAALAAGGEAYLTGELSACAGSCGPGSLHLINGIYESNRNRAPVVAIASQLSTEVIGSEWPQEVDFPALYSHCSVFCEQILNPEEAQRITVEACQAALTKRGVAVIVLPVNVSMQTVSHVTQYSVHRPNPVIRPSDSELEQVASHLNKGKKVAIYVGSGVKGAHDEVVALAAKLKAPIGHSSKSKDFIEYDNPYNMGMNGMLGGKPGFDMVEHCDTLLLLGTDFAYTQFYPDKATIIQVDEDGTHLGRRHPVNMGLIGDVKSTAAALLKYVDEKTDTAFLDQCLKTKAEAEKAEAKETAVSKSIIHPQYLVSLINQYADDDALVTGDCGSPMVWLLRHFKTNGKRRTLASLSHGTMANALPQAIGFKKAYKDRQVISLSGDGGLAMLMGELLTVVQEKVDIKIVVFNNSSLNFVELEQKVEGLVDHYTDLQNPDFAKLAESIGIKGWKVDKPEELEGAVKAFLSAKGPALLDVKTSGYELVMPPKVTAGEVSGMALYGTKAIMQGRVKDVTDLLIHNFIK
ncbi:ubiquinone-dependent pyruvate dehydrogenase [Bartonella sp. W8122]|uniref:thiamine pyrophosphate-dependent enzyme n=1 Tax=Bartonella TaxID=773 RepID=UPI0018DD9D97|nr:MULTISPECIES: thiamine pyrophosphate-dependent enzyme [Bartonella]MBH9994097.1 ubiquinone-dependent pyruvate dehydrogenase [Bartonella sp. P0291]MBH9997558.1 ubiquinone-dependent pyruvate dehydrogenase [Bartonella sp. M0192]MBH9999718.1 ubiquinone-dependent pyruvate dehydrogenase [Bartonella sp. M0191]MBI0001885.1 ubiquinone-dependent pyruvate dehydrogenase [Bartonella sp. W8122]MBI0008661.1 ubiquinone-dependent pyruvate dehydrogenase [Bartonella sp. M0193]